MADSVFAGGTKIIEQQLGYEVARYAFGPAAERRRRVTDDPQVEQAVALVRQASTPGALLGLAGGAAGRSSLIDDADSGGNVEVEGAIRHDWFIRSLESVNVRSAPECSVIASRRGSPSARSSHKTARSNGMSGTAGTSWTTSTALPFSFSPPTYDACVALRRPVEQPGQHVVSVNRAAAGHRSSDHLPGVVLGV